MDASAVQMLFSEGPMAPAAAGQAGDREPSILSASRMSPLTFVQVTPGPGASHFQ